MASVNKRAYIEAAHLCGESEYMDRVANRIKERAAGYASAHDSHDGRGETYSKSFITKRVPATGKAYVTDRLIQNTDPAALSKEFGHMSYGANPKWVPGQFSLLRAISGG